MGTFKFYFTFISVLDYYVLFQWIREYIQHALKFRKNIYEGRLNAMKICFQCYQERFRIIFSNEAVRIQEFDDGNIDMWYWSIQFYFLGTGHFQKRTEWFAKLYIISKKKYSLEICWVFFTCKKTDAVLWKVPFRFDLKRATSFGTPIEVGLLQGNPFLLSKNGFKKCYMNTTATITVLSKREKKEYIHTIFIIISFTKDS